MTCGELVILTTKRGPPLHHKPACCPPHLFDQWDAQVTTAEMTIGLPPLALLLWPTAILLTS